MSNFEYVKKMYGVDPVIGQRVSLGSKQGTIAADRGHYIGVRFDGKKHIDNVHPTDIVYLEKP